MKTKPKHFFLQVSTQNRLFPSILIYDDNNVCPLIFQMSKKFQAPLTVAIFTSPILEEHKKDKASLEKKVHRAEQQQHEVQTGNLRRPSPTSNPFFHIISF